MNHKLLAHYPRVSFMRKLSKQYTTQLYCILAAQPTAIKMQAKTINAFHLLRSIAVCDQPMSFSFFLSSDFVCFVARLKFNSSIQCCIIFNSVKSTSLQHSDVGFFSLLVYSEAGRNSRPCKMNQNHSFPYEIDQVSCHYRQKSWLFSR